MIRADEELAELMEDFFEREVRPDLVDDVERTGRWPSHLWDKALHVQIPSIGIEESAGGVGGSVADVAALIRIAAHHACPLPLLEHHLASYVMAEAGLAQVPGPLALVGLGPEPVPRVAGGQVNGRLELVAWGADVAAVVLLTTDHEGRTSVAVIDPADAVIEPHVDLGGTPVPTLVLDGTSVRTAPLADPDGFWRRAEVLRCAAVTGMLSRLYDLTATYVSERHQFGKPVGSFQAVQVHTVTLAQAASISMVAVDRAVSAVAHGDGHLEVAAASVVVGEHAVLASRSAHQAHGAIGMTREYPLQQVTRRLHAWRQAWRPLTEAQEDLGREVLGAARLSRLVARHPQEGRPA